MSTSYAIGIAPIRGAEAVPFNTTMTIFGTSEGLEVIEVGVAEAGRQEVSQGFATPDFVGDWDFELNTPAGRNVPFAIRAAGNALQNPKAACVRTCTTALG